MVTPTLAVLWRSCLEKRWGQTSKDKLPTNALAVCKKIPVKSLNITCELCRYQLGLGH